LLALRVPAPAVPGRPGLWFPWRLQSWRFVRFGLWCVRSVVLFALLVLLPWLVALLLRSLA
jgi:hypothetical protein